jgi:uncharacterized protein YqjF (DUF2071 family)
MASLTPEEQIGLPVLECQWQSVAFIHWPVETSVVQALLPAGLVADEHDGSAWLTLTPLRMADVQPPGGLTWPRLSFPEINFRTYVQAPNGHDGIVFLAIEASSELFTKAARALVGAPYQLGDLSLTEHGGKTTYAGARRDGQGSYLITLRPAAPIEEPSERDVWLTGRWRLYTRHIGMLLETPVEHEPWPLASATVDELHETISSLVGLPGPGAEPLIHYAAAVRDVRIGMSRRVG